MSGSTYSQMTSIQMSATIMASVPRSGMMFSRLRAITMPAITSAKIA